MLETITPQQKPKYTFRLRSGSHHHATRDADGKVAYQNIEPGGTFCTDKNMRASIAGRQRWELLEEADQETLGDLRERLKILEGQLTLREQEERRVEIGPDDSDDLESMNIKQLKSMAGSMEPPVDLSTCTGKTEIVNAIRLAVDSA